MHPVDSAESAVMRAAPALREDIGGFHIHCPWCGKLINRTVVNIMSFGPFFLHQCSRYMKMCRLPGRMIVWRRLLVRLRWQ